MKKIILFLLMIFIPVLAHAVEQIQIRRDTAANWTSNNPTLAQGEWALEYDTGKLKIGDGTTSWTGLSYFTSGGSTYYTWNSISATTQTLVTANAYIPTSASLTTFTLPSSPALGDHYIIAGSGSGGWTLAQNASQKIYYGNTVTTSGTGGSLASTLPRDEVEIICIATNTFEVINSIGTLTVV